jgi:acyl-CoA thioester hydrolase
LSRENQQRARPRSVSTMRVRYGETDQMGVVYHAEYLVWCDTGRTELIRELGVSYAELEREGLFLAVTDASLRYHAAARYDDMIRVETWIDRVQSRTVRFAYEILRDTEPRVRLATASTRLVALDRDARPRTFPPHVMDRFRTHLEAHA